ncbi:acetylcholine receptor subunit delta [Caerostris darwini]|uniref:Acetylcholine receptor subunit delta n=1 Tax=Caerostris darwini TaxID=1538125 RepID=A0AAV4RE58_9ARAC|nr:acetylcholine receptor subunit delta [Caerostris darwini]
MTVKPLPFIIRGGVWWSPRWVFRTTCIPNLKYFPFDKHSCEVIIVSVSEEGDLLQTNYSTTIQHATYVRTNHLKENNLWSLLSAKSSKTRMEIDEGIMSDVGIFEFEFERTMPMVALAVLTPSLVSVVLLLATFWMGTGNVTRSAVNASSILVSAGNLFTLGEILPVTGAVTPMIVEYIASVLVFSTFSLLQDVLMSLLASCRKQPPISFTTVLEKLPKWALLMLALAPPTSGSLIANETFSFSELSETNRTESNDTGDDSATAIQLKHPWEKHILLMDRLMFYLLGFLILLLILSILITE